MFLTDIRLEECVLEPSILFLLYLILFPINIRLIKMCNKAVDDNPSTIKYVPDIYKTQEMSDKAVDEYSITLEFAPD